MENKSNLTPIHRITRAYCIELKEVVTITQARKKFLSMDPRPIKFHFLCSDEKCRKEKIRVIGVNYKENAQELVIHRAAHFREHDSHLLGCEWEKPPEEEDSNGLLPGETEEAARKRRARRKLSNFIDIFDPSDDDDHSQDQIESGNHKNVDFNSLVEKPCLTKKEQDSHLPGATKTSDLERLVESFREAKETLTSKEFSELELKIKGIGKMRLAQYFQRLSTVQASTTQRVIYGGATLVKRYGKNDSHARGFLFQFYDKVEGKRVSLYVSQAMMKQYHHRKYIDDIISKDDQVRYFTIYVLGHFEPADDERRSLNLVVSDLRHFVIVLGPAKAENSAAPSVSNDSNTLATK